MATTPTSKAIDATGQPLWWDNGGVLRKTTWSEILTLLYSSFVEPTVERSPQIPLSGFNITVPDSTAAKVWMHIKPAGTLAAGTITLPAASTTADGKEVLITSTQIITALTIALNGAAAANGAPTTLAANVFATLRFSVADNSWYRVA